MNFKSIFRIPAYRRLPTMALVRIAFLLCLCALGFSQVTSKAAAKCPENTWPLKIGQLHPTQLEVSHTLVKMVFKGYLRHLNDSTSLAQVFRNRFERAPLPVVVGPGPDQKVNFYLLDNHHAAVPVQLAVEKGLIGAEDAIVCILPRALAGFRVGQSYEVFVNALQRQGVGYFGSEKAKQIQSGDLSPVDAYTDLLSRKLSLDDLADNRLRAGVGLILSAKGISGSDFVDYMEFFLVERLAKDFPTFDETNPKHMRDLTAAIWGNPEILQFLQTLARKPTYAQTQKSLEAAASAWQHELEH